MSSDILCTTKPLNEVCFCTFPALESIGFCRCSFVRCIGFWHESIVMCFDWNLKYKFVAAIIMAVEMLTMAPVATLPSNGLCLVDVGAGETTCTIFELNRMYQNTHNHIVWHGRNEERYVCENSCTVLHSPQSSTVPIADTKVRFDFRQHFGFNATETIVKCGVCSMRISYYNICILRQ